MREKLSNSKRVEFWTKDGRYHVLKPYEPTEEDRRMFPVSYPEGDDGPFYRWSCQSFSTREFAEKAIENGTV